MAARRKFGAFGGVFTPAILTILGVIMYLRLPSIVGNAGYLYAALIILLAHVISITTGLSVSSIATDKRVKAGGSYYIISRSLGLPIGGTLGLALFVGLSFGISLYLIGFAESFLTFFQIAIDPVTLKPDINAIRVTGSLTLLAVTIVTFISTSLAIKTQFFIMAAIVISLMSIVIGNSDPAFPASETFHLDPIEGGTSIFVLFGIFFPAVTGFEAGVSMSGDLRNPKRDIPGGTLWAIAIGFVVYLALSAFLAWKVPAEQLTKNPNVLLDYALVRELVVAGIWGATISSALGSILGAPRILQACALDRIGPKFFGKGHGPSNEPRNALLLTFVIAELGILMGSLDLIAEVVSMFFMASYGVLNLACAVESWASPDFRPDFKIPRMVSVVGAVTCLVLMIQLNVMAMFGAFFVMFLIFVWLTRKQLALEGGDTWSGIWSSIVRAGLERLSRGKVHARNWRPNILQFSDATTRRAATIDFGHAVVSANGVLTEFRVGPTAEEQGGEQLELPTGVFCRRVPGDDPLATIASVSRFHGFSGVQPNTASIDWHMLQADPQGSAALLAELVELDFNTLITLFRHGADLSSAQHVDIWWRGSGRHVALGLALVRFLTATEGWRQARLRFIVTVSDPGLRRSLEQRLAAWLKDARVEAEVVVLDSPVAPDTFEALCVRHSVKADLAIVVMDEAEQDAQLPQVVGTLGELRKPVVLVRAATSFHDPFPMVDLQATGRLEADDAREVWRARPETLNLLQDPTLAAHPIRYHAALSEALDDYHRHVPSEHLQRFGEVLAQIERLMTRAIDQLQRAAGTDQLPRRRRTAFRVEDGLLRAVRQLLDEFTTTFGGAQRDALSIGLATLDKHLRAIEDGVDDEIVLAFDVDRGRGRVKKSSRRWPLRRQVRSLHEGAGAEAVRASLQHLGATRQTLLDSLLASTAWGLTAVGRLAQTLVAEGDGEADFDAARADLGERVRAWRSAADTALTAGRRELAEFARNAAQAIAGALAEPAGARAPRSKGRAGEVGPIDVAGLEEELGDYYAAQHHLVGRAELDVALRALHHKLQAMTEQLAIDLTQRLEHGVLANLERFMGDLRALETAVGEDPDSTLQLTAKLNIELDDDALLARLVEQCSRDADALPESVDTLTEASFQALAEAKMDEIEPMTIAVRRLVGFLVDNELVGALREEFAALGTAVQRAGNGARDVLRLVTFEGAVLADGDADHLAEERLELVSSAISRVDVEHKAVRRAWDKLQARVPAALEEVVGRTRGAAIGSAAGKLDRFIRTQERISLSEHLAGVGGRVSDWFRRIMVDLSYRWSRGMLLARRLQHSKEEPASAVERIIKLQRRVQPAEEVLDALPMFYRQIFLGRAAGDPAYWLESTSEVKGAARAIDNHRRGHPGALWVSGRPGSGLRSLTRRIIQRHFGNDRAFVVRPTEAGSVDPDRFERAMEAALGVTNLDRGLETLPAGSAVVIDSLELWWERSPQGLAVIERLEALIERHGDRLLFVITVNEYVMRLLRRLGRLVDQALATVHTQPLEALRLREAIMKRHAATGLELRLSGDDHEPSEWRTARFFSSLCDYTEGYIGYALLAWIGHIERVERDAIVMKRPRALELGALDSLEPEWTALLIELVLHRRLDITRLTRITGSLQSDKLEQLMSGLTRSGLVTTTAGGDAFQIDRFALPHVTRWLRDKEVL